MKVGLFSIGLDTYWAQFIGLKERLLGYHAEIKRGLEKGSDGVVDAPVAKIGVVTQDLPKAGHSGRKTHVGVGRALPVGDGRFRQLSCRRAGLFPAQPQDGQFRRVARPHPLVAVTQRRVAHRGRPPGRAPPSR